MRCRARRSACVEEPDTGVEGGAAPALERPEACLIKFFAGRHKVFQRHARRHQALVGVAEYKFSDLDGSLWHIGSSAGFAVTL